MTTNQVLAKKVLDNAIAEVARAEFNRLSCELDPIQTANKVECALRHLEGLQDGIMPAYDEWDALFYASWYQGSQINLTYSIIRKMLQDGVSLDGSLHIVDWGCGALAMQFGVALAAADAISQGQAIDAIRIDLIDDSASMIAIGKKIWDAFTQKLSRYPQLTHVSKACEKIDFQKVNTTDVQKIPGGCWISAIHAVYEENIDELNCELSELVNELAPDVLLTTTHKDYRSLLLEVCSLCDSEYDSEMTSSISQQFSGYLGRTYKWRGDLCSKILHDVSQDTICIDRGFIKNYLTKYRVRWQRHDAVIRTHTRRQS